MEARLNLFTNPVAAKFVKHVNAAGQVARSAGVPLETFVEHHHPAIRRRLRAGSVGVDHSERRAPPSTGMIVPVR
jgi:hypothetical protein